MAEVGLNASERGILLLRRAGFAFGSGSCMDLNSRGRNGGPWNRHGGRKDRAEIKGDVAFHAPCVVYSITNGMPALPLKLICTIAAHRDAIRGW